MRTWTIAAARAVAVVAACGPATGLAQDAMLARSLAATCANCHGLDGNARGDIDRKSVV